MAYFTSLALNFLVCLRSSNLVPISVIRGLTWTCIGYVTVVDDWLVVAVEVILDDAEVLAVDVADVEAVLE
jgi:hypothetical protein